jgi:predicted transcriptional regulator
MTATTIKVSTQTRDRVAELARARNTTANSVLEMLLEEHLRRERMKSVREAMARSSEEDWRTYYEETAAWDLTTGDGLEGW